MSDNMMFDTCPICNAIITVKFTLRRYGSVNSATISKRLSGEQFVDVTDYFPLIDDTTIDSDVMCDNDHSESDIINYINLNKGDKNV